MVLISGQKNLLGMKIKHLYLLLFLIGIVFPYWELTNFLIENGFDFPLFFEKLIANRISRFFVYDVVISAIVLLVFIFQNKKGIKKYWIPILTTFIIGVSAGFPLFLYQKELVKETRDYEK